MYNAVIHAIDASKIVEKNDEAKTIKMTKENINSITELDLKDNDIQDITGIEQFVNLITLDMSENHIENIELLSILMNLKNLNLGINRIDNINPLGELVKLEQLELHGNKIENIEILSNLISLKILNLNGNKIEDITALSKLNDLQELSIGSNSIRDISPIEKLKLKIFYAEQQVKDENSKGYTKEELYIENCTLVNEGKTVLLNKDVREALVEIKGGAMYGTQLIIERYNVVEIRIKSMPKKLTYEKGEELDLSRRNNRSRI